MKRSGPPKRRTPLKQGEPMERKPLARKVPVTKKGNGLARRSPPRAKPKPKREEREIRLSRIFWEVVTGKGRKRCVRCGSAWHIQAHHVVSQQAIRKRCRELGIDPVEPLWDPRNGMCLCEHCHMNHEVAADRIPAKYLMPQHWTFARWLGLDHLLAVYPESV